MRDSLRIPITDEQLDADPYLPPYYRPDDDDEVLRYLRERRTKLGGPMPTRRTGATPSAPVRSKPRGRWLPVTGNSSDMPRCRARAQ